MDSRIEIEKRLANANGIIKKMSQCIQNAIEIDLSECLKENQTETNNAFGHLKGDFINTRIIHGFNDSNIDAFTFPRQGWRGVLMVDHHNKLVFSITSLKRLETIRTEKRSSPHYMQTLCFALNSKIVAPNRQLNFLDAFEDASGFEQDYLYDDFVKICGNYVPLNDEYLYCAIAHSCQGCQLQNLSLIVMDDEMNQAYCKELNGFLTAQYTQDNHDYTNTEYNPKPQKHNEVLVTLKQNNKRKAN